MVENVDNVVLMPWVTAQSTANEPVDGIVTVLERYLNMARAGELVGVAIAGVLWDGYEPRCFCTSTAWESSGGHNMGCILESAIQRLTRRYGDNMGT